MKSIVTIGGGTGQYALLSGLKKYPVRLTAIVSMADNGGSTGILRDELGVLPPGDVRQCLVALSEADKTLRELFGYRFEQGGLRGHSFGNIFLSTLEKITGSFEDAVQEAGKILAVRGKVIPVSTGGMTLVCGSDGSIRGEHAISQADNVSGESLKLEPAAYANPRAVEAIENADVIVIGPGNLFCSVMPNLLVKGIPEAIKESKAKVIYNCNLMTRRGHTEGFGVSDFVNEIERHIGPGRINFVTCNNALPSAELLERYTEEGKPVAVPNTADLSLKYELVCGDLVSRTMPVQNPGDMIRRTYIRHDPRVLAAMIFERCLGGV